MADFLSEFFFLNTVEGRFFYRHVKDMCQLNYNTTECKSETIELYSHFQYVFLIVYL